MDDVVFTALDRYFNILSTLGYKNYTSVYKLIVLIFIQELLDSDCSSFISEDESRIIEKALTCLYGSDCLIPYRKYIVNTSVICSST